MAFVGTVSPLDHWISNPDWLDTSSGQILLRQRDGSSLTAENIHLAIQDDTKIQYELYRAAMALWR